MKSYNILKYTRGRLVKSITYETLNTWIIHVWSNVPFDLKIMLNHKTFDKSLRERKLERNRPGARRLVKWNENCPQPLELFNEDKRTNNRGQVCSMSPRHKSALRDRTLGFIKYSLHFQITHVSLFTCYPMKFNLQSSGDSHSEPDATLMC